MQANKSLSDRARDGGSDVLRTLPPQKTSNDWEVAHPTGSITQSHQNSVDNRRFKFHEATPTASMNNHLVLETEPCTSGRSRGKIRQWATHASNERSKLASKPKGKARQSLTQASKHRLQGSVQSRVQGKPHVQCSEAPAPSQNKVDKAMANQLLETRLHTCEQPEGKKQLPPRQKSRGQQGSIPKNACGTSYNGSNSAGTLNDSASTPPFKRSAPPKDASSRTRTSGAYPSSTHRLGPDGVNRLVGQRVESFWEDNDPQWVEAIVTHYQLDKRLHCLAYDLDTPDESWEWVDLDDLFREGQARLVPGRASVGLQALAPAGDSARAAKQAQKPRKKRRLEDPKEDMDKPAVCSKKLKGAAAGSISDLRTELDAEVSKAGASSLLERRLHPGEGRGGEHKGALPQAPFHSDFLVKKLEEGSLEELEAMLESVTKRRTVVMDELLEMDEDRLKKEDPMVVNLVRLEQLERRAGELEQAANTDRN
ncbi:hypothetical protein BSKO_04317 [Bryopsis sp. KO-2023]|nr:hypothetical protein BSKO_04317 [Bryopsis sp. KO-2023]